MPARLALSLPSSRAFPRLQRLVSYRFDGVSEATWADLAAVYPLEEPQQP